MTASDEAGKRSAGFALILVAWFLVLISAIAIYLLVDSRSETAIARNVKVAANAEALADAGIAEAAFNRSEPAAANRWPLDGVPHVVSLPAGTMTIRVSDERLKINPNHASDALMAGLFEAVGVNRGLAQRLGAAVADWVGPEMKPRPLGAKQDQYAAAGRSYGPPNAPLESLDELQLVLGMTPEIFARVRPYLTIYTDDGQPDPKQAAPVIRTALQLAGQKIAAAEAVQPSDGEGAAESPDAGATDAADASQDAPSAMPSDLELIALDVTAQSADGGVFVRHAVVRIDPANLKGYVVLDWRRGELAPDAIQASK